MEQTQSAPVSGIRAFISRLRGGEAVPEIQQENPAPAKQEQSYVPAVDPKEGLERFSGLNFMQLANKEKLQAAFQNQDPVAFAEAMNSVFAGSQMFSIQAVQPLIEAAVKKAVEEINPRLESRLRERSINDLLRNDDRYANATLRGAAELYANKFKDQFPTASAEEIKEAVDAYIDSLKGAFQSKVSAPAESENSLATLLKSIKGE